MVVKKLPYKKRGRLLLLGDYLDGQLRACITEIRQMGLVVNTSVLIAAAKWLVLHHDSNWLWENGGHLELSTHWAKGRLRKIWFSKRRVTTKASLTLVDFEERKSQFVFNDQTIIELEEIPDDLVVNWDQTGIHYVPVSDWTMEKVLQFCLLELWVENFTTSTYISSQDTKMFTSSTQYSFWLGYNLHWKSLANETTVMKYLERILFPYFVAKRIEL